MAAGFGDEMKLARTIRERGGARALARFIIQFGELLLNFTLPLIWMLKRRERRAPFFAALTVIFCANPLFAAPITVDSDICVYGGTSGSSA
jgi:hypothetical protein